MNPTKRVKYDDPIEVTIEKPNGDRIRVDQNGNTTKLPAKAKRKPSKRKQRKTK